MQHILGYIRSHWTPPSDKYSPSIAPAAAMVINFSLKNQVVMKCEIAASKASNQNTQNGPSTQLIKATSCLVRLNATIGQWSKLVIILITKEA
jgi:hypothetical protein